MDILALSRRIPLLGFFGSSASDDDFADRLNYKYTVAILVIFAFIVTNKHFGHNQINCWVPALFSKNFEEYTNLVCWITNTYYIPFDKQIPNTESERRSTELRYYQWVAYILLILALLFYLPRIIWRTLSLRSGVDIKDVIEASHDFKSVSKLDKNRKMMEYMIGTIDQYVDDPRRQRSERNMNIVRRTIVLFCFMFGKFLGNYLVVLYLFVKILYIVNCVGQLFLISILLGRNFYIYGASIFRDIIQGKGYADSEYFPRVTMCKFQVRELGLKNFSHEYNVQCVLPINLFNQQIFTFLWFWYLILLVINTSALLIWVYRFIPINQYNYAIRRIKMLRIRLIETRKLPNNQQSNDQQHSATFNGGKKSNVKANGKYTNGHLDANNDTDNHNQRHQYKPARVYETTSDEYANETSSDVFYDNEQRIFPNLPDNYFYDYSNISSASASQRLRSRKEKNVTFSTDIDDDNNNNNSNSNPNNYNSNYNYNSNNVVNSEMNNYTSYNINYDNRYNFSDFEPYVKSSSFTKNNYKAFVYEYLEADGMFMLRMIGSNSGDFVCTQVLHNLWKLFLCKKALQSESKKDKKATTITASGGMSATMPRTTVKSTPTTMNERNVSSSSRGRLPRISENNEFRPVSRDPKHDEQLKTSDLDEVADDDDDDDDEDEDIDEEEDDHVDVDNDEHTSSRTNNQQQHQEKFTNTKTNLKQYRPSFIPNKATATSGKKSLLSRLTKNAFTSASSSASSSSSASKAKSLQDKKQQSKMPNFDNEIKRFQSIKRITRRPPARPT